MASNVKWSEEEEAKLHLAAEIGRTYDEASAEIGRSPNGCYQWAVKLGIRLAGPRPQRPPPSKTRRRKLSAEELELIRIGAKSGKTCPEMAAELGRSVATIYYAATKNDFRLRANQPWTDEDKEAVRAGCAEGLSYETMGEDLHRTPCAVYEIAKAMLGVQNLTGRRPRYSYEKRDSPSDRARSMGLPGLTKDQSVLDKAGDKKFCAAMVAAGYEQHDPSKAPCTDRPIVMQPMSHGSCSSSSGWEIVGATA